MGAHLYVRAPLLSASSSMSAHSGRFLVLLLVISTIHHAKGSDSAALIEFKDSLTNGMKLTSWIATKNPCNNNTANWEGLVCTNGTVWGIQLEKKALEGYIDTNILSKLSSLMSISFNNNNFKDTFPEFGMLDGMQEISLANNKFSSEIPANAFKGMKWLKKLDLANNKLMGQIPSSLARLPELKELMLQGNQFEGEIPKFAPGKLKVANFANNHLRGHIPEALQHFPATQFLGNELCGPPLGECQKKVTPPMIITIALVVVVAVAALIFAVAILCCRRDQDIPVEVINNGSITAFANLSMQEKGRAFAHNGNKADVSLNLTFLAEEEERFDLADLLKASAAVLGSGMFGASYKTLIAGRKVMVVKRFKQMNNFGKEDFYQHMKRLSRLKHPNILPIVAFYYRKDEKLLVSDYVDSISLAFHLHRNRCDEIGRPDWPTRLKIVKGVVRGLQDLYNKLPSLIVPHGHLKSSNVLLTKNYEPLLTDYGLVPVINPEHARSLMMAYKSPEYNQLGRISKRTDIWCLGILILEIMTGKIPVYTLHQSKGNDTDNTDFINSVVDQESDVDMLDKEMMGRDKNNEGEMIKLLKIGLSCCEKDSKKRMDIKQVLERIEDVKEKDGPEDDFQSTYSSELDKLSTAGLSDDLNN
ncbi:pollen receptor-like kinase 1 [Bidens hawaiensis]|uniref:pollen receptor-like kinase 1 n=1 Tax=Bidens hawaiensis TaxID=980011 RepID=UPI00404AE4E4